LNTVTCKILEHIICRHLLKHLEKNKILTNLNHGFRTGYSCETQLITTINDFHLYGIRTLSVRVQYLEALKSLLIFPLNFHPPLLFSLFWLIGSWLAMSECFLWCRIVLISVEVYHVVLCRMLWRNLGWQFLYCLHKRDDFNFANINLEYGVYFSQLIRLILSFEFAYETNNRIVYCVNIHRI
jgi:hypothetical protein